MKRNIFKRTFALLLASLLLAATLLPGMAVTRFDDVKEGSWYTGAVRFVSRNGLMKGTDATTFSTKVEFTRAMSALVLAQLAGADLSVYTETRFIDVPDGKWYTAAVAWADENDIANGTGEAFQPSIPVTREQLSLMISKFAEKYNIKNKAPAGAEDLEGFTDVDRVHDWAIDGVKWAVHNGLISGMDDGSLDPRGTTTRAQAAQIFYNLSLMKETGCIPDTSDVDSIVVNESDVPRIVCWGDSLTEGYNATNSYPEEIAKLSGLDVINYGIAAETAEQIACRQGAIHTYVYPMTIPADTTPVAFDTVTGDGNPSDMAFYATNGVEITIAGVTGRMMYDDESSTYFFTRNEPGEEVVITELTQVATEGMVNRTSNDIQVIFIGSNNKPNLDSIHDIIALQKKMIEYSDTDKYIIVGYTAKPLVPDLVKINDLLEETYGDKFLDASEYFTTQALEDAGIEPTEEDLANIAQNQIPSSLLTFWSNGEPDDLHGNEIFNELLGKIIYEKIVELGYLA